LTVTPALSLILLGRSKVERRTSPVVAVLQRGYTAALSRIVVRPHWAYATFALLTVVGIALTPLLGQSLFPGFKERDFLVHWVSQPGTSADEMRRTTLAVSKELREIPGVRNFGAHIGQAFLGEEVAGVNLGENWISIDPSVDYDSTLDKIEDVNDAYAGLFRETQTYLDERIEEVISGGKEPIVVRVYGQNLSVLREKAAEIEEIMGSIEGVEDQHTDISTDVPQLQVEVDLAKADKYGLKPGDVRRAAATLVAGEEVGDIFRGGKAYDVVVWSTPQTRSSVQDIQNMRIDTPSGKTVRLADVADVSLQPSPNAIDREGDSRRLDVSATFEGDLGSVVEQLQDKLEGVQFEQGYHAEILGEWQERESAQQTLLATAVIAGAAILLLLQASFGTWRLALLSFLTLPMALVGGVIAAFLGGGVVSLGSLIGFFTVFGIAARNGILLINHFQHLEREEGMTFGRDLVVRGARERLSPILMTSLATGLALIPLVIFGERPGQEIEHPLAIVILGGLVTSTLLNLFVTPSLYLRFGRSRRDIASPATEPKTQTA
jgi:Cu/Ag efflux pump CusA